MGITADPHSRQVFLEIDVPHELTDWVGSEPGVKFVRELQAQTGERFLAVFVTHEDGPHPATPLIAPTYPVA